MAIIKQYNKRTGLTYAYESYSYWDKEKKQSRAKRKVIGRVDTETGEIVPTRKRKPKVPQPTAENYFKTFRRQSYGAPYLLDSIAKQLHLSDGLHTIFGKEGQNILALAYYLVLAPNNTLFHYESWAKTHAFSKHQLTSQRISELFQQINQHQIQQFFQWFLKKHGESEYWAYDTTSISSYSKLLSRVQYGYNKEHQPFPQLNLALLYGEKSRLPFCYRQLPGNITDVKTIPWLLNQLEDIQAHKINLVMDRGHYSKKNVMELIQSPHQFILGVKCSVRYVKASINGLNEVRESFKNYDKSEKLYHHSVRITDEFKASATSHYPVTLHLYYGPDIAKEKQMRFDERLQQVYEDLQRGKIAEQDQTFSLRYFKKLKDGMIQVNELAIQEQKEYMGWFGLLTNTALSAKEVLQIYRNKDVVEKAFHDLKDRLNMRRLRTSSESSLEGKLFVQFIALILVSHIKKVMEEYQLFGDYTLNGLLMELNQIDSFINDSNEFYLSEITGNQQQLFRYFNVEMGT